MGVVIVTVTWQHAGTMALLRGTLSPDAPTTGAVFPGDRTSCSQARGAAVFMSPDAQESKGSLNKELLSREQANSVLDTPTPALRADRRHGGQDPY